MTPCRFFSESKPTISWIWVSNPTSGESSDARSARPVRLGAYTSWKASSKKEMTFCQHQPPCHPPCTSTNVAMLASLSLVYLISYSTIFLRCSLPSNTAFAQLWPPVRLPLDPVQHALAQEGKSRLAVHHAFNQLHPRHMALDLS